MLPFYVGDDYDMTKRLFVLFGLMMGAGVVTAAPLVDGDIEAGKTRAAACAACHGPKGNMESDQFPKLAGQGAPYIYEQLKLFKSGKRQNAIMAGQAAGLSDTDMKNLAAYYAAQQTRPGAADVKVAPAGAVIYHGGNAEEGVPACSGCHGPSGLGNAAAKFPRLSAQSPQYIATQLKAYRSGDRSGYRNATIMTGVAENLSDDDIQSLASYVAGLGPATGDKSAANEDGALMQNAGGPEVAGGAGQDAPPADAKASDDQSDPADAAAKEKTVSAADDKPSSGSDGAEDGAGGVEDSASAEDAGASAGGSSDNADESKSSGETTPDGQNSGSAQDADKSATAPQDDGQKAADTDSSDAA